LYDARIKEIQAEDHLKQLADRETGRLRSELIRLEKEQQRLGDAVCGRTISVSTSG
jgi:hypothetical protein